MTSNNAYHELWNPRPQVRQQPSASEDDSPADPDTITQHELRELIRLLQLYEDYSRYRKSIRKRLLAGAIVEPGLCHVRIEEREVVRFSRPALERLFGVEWVKQLRNKIPPELHRKMVIEDRGVPEPLGE